jgi:type I restriction enzyme S subunit
MRPYLRVANVFEARIDTSDVLQMNFTPKEYEIYQLKFGDILLNEGQSLEWVGRPAIFHGEVPGACFQNTLIRFRAHSCVLPEFALLVFRAYLHSQKFQQIARWTTNIAHLSSQRFAALEFPVPPLAEQKRITAEAEKLLSTLTAGVASLKQVKDNLKRYRSSVLKTACAGRLVPTEAALARAEGRNFESASEFLSRLIKTRHTQWESEQSISQSRTRTAKSSIQTENRQSRAINCPANQRLPEGWAWATLGQLAPLQAGYAFPSHGFKKKGIRLLKGNNIRDGWICNEEIDYWESSDLSKHAQFTLHTGDIVLAMDRPVYSSGTKAVKVALLDSAWDGSLLLQRVGRFSFIDKTLAPFIYFFLRSEAFRSRLIMSQNGSQDGKDLPHVSAATVNATYIPLPPLAEQKRIVSEIERHISIVQSTESAVQAALSHAENLRRTIITKAVEGRLVPQNPSEEPAEVLLERLSRNPSAAPAEPLKRRRITRGGRS